MKSTLYGLVTLKNGTTFLTKLKYDKSQANEIKHAVDRIRERYTAHDNGTLLIGTMHFRCSDISGLSFASRRRDLPIKIK